MENYHCFMGKLTISMAIIHSKLLVYQRVKDPNRQKYGLIILTEIQLLMKHINPPLIHSFMDWLVVWNIWIIFHSIWDNHYNPSH